MQEQVQSHGTQFRKIKAARTAAEPSRAPVESKVQSLFVSGSSSRVKVEQLARHVE